ncbi:hypothetical protein, partial [Promicromonospora kroppenstedtii]|uniref:hypothetical protein n=1 Tax=Promicromonospora kroppenstedtii TaxID=440482 RepID=UPI00055DC0E2
PADLVDRLAAVLAEQAPDAELVVLATGRPGDGVHLGTETDAPETADPETAAPETADPETADPEVDA